MFPPRLLLPALLSAASVSAQYYSAGWSPGQPIPAPEPEFAPPPFNPAAAPAAPTRPSDAAPTAGGGSGSFFDVNRILTSGPVAGLFEKVGVNISERIAQANVSLWDERIPLITDDNYDEIIVNEELAPEEEDKRVWFIVISASAGQQSGMSKITDDQVDAAYNITLIENDLPNVRWGRIDYLNVTYITTKWSIWQAPYLVVITDRGQSLRFYKTTQVRLKPEFIREFLKEEGWRQTPPWRSSFGPGGSREYILHYYGLTLKAIYDFLVRVPKWLLMIGTGAAASVVMRLMHRGSPNPPAQTAPAPSASTATSTVTATTPQAGTATANPSPSKGKGKQRKNAKK
ncbi:hypothetical protein CERSUDRAFT_130463 [Gelatoporia subvermispora B]|uniref:Thioredoxin-like fold domain-containing protein n=1 Tax=Ceriporiopsis subvermispora (strain B) TaxID=914234 RepID=M2RNW0_CERS8|nr:hypothetical protein CERSUDRAFT_130463 [Gelatoporia subvermispora B]